jgi:hypothetical protein
MKTKIAMVLVAVAAGCASSKAAQLRTQAAADFQCSEAQLESTAVWAYIERVRGCGKDNIYVWDGTAKNWVSPLDRASFELSCPKSAMLTRYLSSQNVGVEGCGKRAVYSLILMQWVLNSTSDR